MLFETLNKTISTLDTSTINEDRKTQLLSLTEAIQLKKNAEEIINLNFICTHNSRRSHLSQIWAQTLASYYRVDAVNCYSGGTEATALFPMVAKTLENQGFKINNLSETQNPIYSIKFGNNSLPLIGFSKTFDDVFNPENGFVAIMTCSSADAGCPFIAGASKRIALTFEDPKAYDNTPQQTEKYLERSLQIATELKFVFSEIK
jgi:arsenate reductase